MEDCWSFICCLSWKLGSSSKCILSLFYRYYFGRCSSEPPGLVPLPYSQGRSTRYSDSLHNFFVTIPKCYKDVYVNSFFPLTAKLWNSLPVEFFLKRKSDMNNSFRVISIIISIVKFNIIKIHTKNTHSIISKYGITRIFIKMEYIITCI